jgi:hypothetical protein
LETCDDEGSEFEDFYDQVEDIYDFFELAPEIFKNIRKIHDIKEQELSDLFNRCQLHEFHYELSSTKTFFLKSMNGKFMIKSRVSRA